MVFGQMNEPPGARFLVGLAALSVAEYFRDVEKKDVLFLVDNVYRHVQAGMEVSGLLGRLPSRVGYQPTLGRRHRRSGRTHHGHATWRHGFGASDLRAGRRLFRSGHHACFLASWTVRLVLSRDVAAEGLYPAVDPLGVFLQGPRPVDRRPAPLRCGPAGTTQRWDDTKN